jgi:hypothetical protein
LRRVAPVGTLEIVRRAGIAFFAAWWSSTPAAATILADWDLAERIARADRVVIGVVEGEEPATSAGRVATTTQIVVERTLLGEEAPRLSVTQLGGVEGRTRVEVPGTVRWRRGDRVLVITFRAADGRDYLVGMALGAFRVEGERLYQRLDVPVTRGGQLLPPPGERTLGLDEVVAIIAAVRR